MSLPLYRDIASGGTAPVQWLGGFSEIGVSDAPNFQRIIAYASTQGGVSMTYNGFTGTIVDWQRVELAPYEVPSRARAAILGIRFEARFVGDTDPGGDVQASMFLFTRLPGQSLAHSALWPMDTPNLPGSGTYNNAGTCAFFRNGDGIRSAQRVIVPLIDRCFEATWGFRGVPGRELTTYRFSAFLQGWLG